MDFVSLAKAVVAGVADVRVCLIVSRDGLALGACPIEQEETALAAWSRVAALGEVERGFVTLPDEVWAFARRGPYAALATAHPSVRPGLLIDRLDQMLLTAEEARLRKDVLRVVPEREAGPAEGHRRPRPSLHPESKASEQPASSLEDTAVSAWFSRLKSEAKANGPSTPPPQIQPSGPSEPPATGEGAPESRQRADPSTRGGSGEERGWTVDRASLSLEFKGLLGPEDREEES